MSDPKPWFDFTINMSVVLSTLGIISAIIMGFTRFARRIEIRIEEVNAALDKRLTVVEKQVEQIYRWWARFIERRAGIRTNKEEED